MAIPIITPVLNFIKDMFTGVAGRAITGYTKSETFVTGITISGNDDFRNIVNECSEQAVKSNGKRNVWYVAFGEKGGKEIPIMGQSDDKENNNLKDFTTTVGCVLWNHKQMGALSGGVGNYYSHWVIIYVFGHKSYNPLNYQSSRGLIDLHTFHEQYPLIPIHDIGAAVTASEIKETAVNAKNLIEKKKHGSIESDDVPKKEESSLKERIKEIHDFRTGIIECGHLGPMQKDLTKYVTAVYGELKDLIGEHKIAFQSSNDIGVGLLLFDAKPAIDVGQPHDFWLFLFMDMSSIYGLSPDISEQLPVVKLGITDITGAKDFLTRSIGFSHLRDKFLEQLKPIQNNKGKKKGKK